MPISVDGLRPEPYRDASRPAPTLQQMAREDVAPAIAHLLGVPFSAPDGTLHPGWFQRQ